MATNKICKPLAVHERARSKSPVRKRAASLSPISPFSPVMPKFVSNYSSGSVSTSSTPSDSGAGQVTRKQSKSAKRGASSGKQDSGAAAAASVPNVAASAPAETTPAQAQDHRMAGHAGDGDGSRPPPKKSTTDKAGTGHYAQTRRRHRKSRSVTVPETGLSLSYDDEEEYESEGLSAAEEHREETRHATPGSGSDASPTPSARVAMSSPTRAPFENSDRLSPVPSHHSAAASHSSAIRSSRANSQSSIAQCRSRSRSPVRRGRSRSRTVANIISAFSKSEQQVSDAASRLMARASRGKNSDSTSSRGPLAAMGDMIGSSNLYRTVTGGRSGMRDVPSGSDDVPDAAGRDSAGMELVGASNSDSTIQPELSHSSASRTTTATSVADNAGEAKPSADSPTPLTTARPGIDGHVRQAASLHQEAAELMIPMESDHHPRDEGLFRSTIGMLRPAPFVRFRNSIKGRRRNA